jgi:hypothetical protein
MSKHDDYHSNTDDLRARVFKDDAMPGAWRVEKINEDGRYKAFAIFAGPNAHQNAIDYARQLFGEFDEISNTPHRPCDPAQAPGSVYPAPKRSHCCRLDHQRGGGRR